MAGATITVESFSRGGSSPSSSPAASSASVGSAYRADFNLPNVESRQGFEVLEEHFGGQGTGESGTVVFRSDKGVNDPSVRGVMEPYLAEVAEVDRVARVVSPYSEEGSNQISDTEGHQGDIGYAVVELDPDVTFENAIQISDDIKAAMPEQAGLQIELGGAIFGEFEPPSSELLGVAFAMVILVLAFGSVLAMGLPISVALAGIGIGTITVGLLSNLITIPDFATQLGLMIGLGVGIDYALFIVTRFREQLHAGDDIGPAVRKAIDTAGRAVAFAGTTVVISLLGMLVMQISFVSGLAIGAAVVVLMTMVAALTLLPALLGFAGNRVELTRWRGLIAASFFAVGLLGLGLKVPVLFAVCLPLAVIVLLASLAVRPAAPARAPARGPAPQPDPRLPLEPAHPAPPVALGHRRGRCSSSCSPCPSSACAWASPTRATTPRRPPPARPTTCWPRASAPGSTAPCWWCPRCPRARPTPPCSGSPTPCSRRRASPSPATSPSTTRTTPPPPCGG